MMDVAHEVVDRATSQRAVALFDELAKIDAGLSVLRSSAPALDLATADGEKAARAFRKRCVFLRSAADDAYETQNKPLLAAQKDARFLRDSIKATVLSIEAPYDLAIQAAEAEVERERAAKREATRQRIAEIRQRIDFMKEMPLRCMGMGSAALDTQIGMLTSIEVDESYGEFVAEANAVQAVAVRQMMELHSFATLRAADAARRDAEEKALAEERAETARQTAELQALVMRERAEKDRIQAAVAATQAEAERAARETLAVQKAAVAAEAARLAAIAKAERDAADAAAAVERAEADRVAREALAEAKRLQVVAQAAKARVERAGPMLLAALKGLVAVINSTNEVSWSDGWQPALVHAVAAIDEAEAA
jgi:colicin import membrane protein